MPGDNDEAKYKDGPFPTWSPREQNRVNLSAELPAQSAISLFRGHKMHSSDNLPGVARRLQ